MLFPSILGLMAFCQIALADTVVTPDANHGWCYCHRRGVEGRLDEGLTSATCNAFPVSVTWDNNDHKCYATSGHSDIDGDTWESHCKLIASGGYEYKGIKYKWDKGDVGGTCS